MTNSYLNPQHAGIQSPLCVLPCGGINSADKQNWTKEDLFPYVNYVLNGKAIHDLFKGFVFNGISTTDQSMIHPLYVGFKSPSRKEDWEIWIDSLFTKDQNIHALSSFVQGHPLDIWVSLPYPHPFQRDFGKMDLQNLDFENIGDRITALKWWIEAFIQRWHKADLQQKLHFRGFLWQRETIYGNDEEVIRAANQAIHSQGYRSVWLPNYGSPGFHKWRELGFDLVAFNSNYYGNTDFDHKWITTNALSAKAYGAGIQINIGKGLIFNETHILDYLNLGLPEHNNYMINSLLVFQFYNQTLKEIMEKNILEYIRIYTFVKGLYIKTPYTGITY